MNTRAAGVREKFEKLKKRRKLVVIVTVDGGLDINPSYEKTIHVQLF